MLVAMKDQTFSLIYILTDSTDLPEGNKYLPLPAHVV